MKGTQLDNCHDFGGGGFSSWGLPSKSLETSSRSSF